MAGIKLCVNIDHIATLRQARGTSYPDTVAGAVICEEAGADGITVHLREDRRHIQDADVFALKGVVKGKYNLEMALSDEIAAIAKKVVPAQITLVPEKREEVTTEGGLDVKANQVKITRTVKEFHDLGVIISLFIEPDLASVEISKECGADYVELHTGTYCEAFSMRKNPDHALAVGHEIGRIYEAAGHALKIGIGLNAGHGLHYDNVAAVLKAPGLDELNIGHSIIARAVFAGLENAVKEMCAAVKG